MLELGGFGLEELEALAARKRTTLAEILATAALYYLAEAASHRLAARVPPFARRPAPDRMACTVSLDESAWSALEEEAARQRVHMGALITHAALFYLAGLSAGAVDSRILARTTEPPAA